MASFEISGSDRGKPVPPTWFINKDGKDVIFAMAPMVGQSDLGFRKLCRKYGATVIYSEMLIASQFATDAGYRKQAFGSCIRADDHPLIVQFAANEPNDFLNATLEAQRIGADAVDLNLGCPQRRARENRFGSYLTDPVDWPLCVEIIRAAASHPLVTIPITVKIRLQPTEEATIEFAQLLAKAGASLVAVHGRQRGSEDRRRDGSADLDAVSKVVQALAPLPVLSNGNVRCVDDVSDNLAVTGAAGLMVAEHLLKDPALFAKVPLSRLSDPQAIKIRSVACDYLRILKELDSCSTHSAENTGSSSHQCLVMEDGSTMGKNGQMVRTMVESDEDEFERYSVWWANVHVVKSHLKSMLGENNTTIARGTFKRAPTIDAVIQCFLKRMGSANIEGMLL